jgi:hypothetical protein
VPKQTVESEKAEADVPRSDLTTSHKLLLHIPQSTHPDRARPHLPDLICDDLLPPDPAPSPPTATAAAAASPTEVLSSAIQPEPAAATMYGWEMLSFNIHDGFLEAIVRGNRSGLLTAADYNNLCQCETLDDIKMHLTATEYGPYLQNGEILLRPPSLALRVGWGSYRAVRQLLSLL